MKIEHIHLDDLYRAYAASVMEIDGKPAALIASEEKGYPCYMYSGNTFEKREIVWKNGGGCMSILPIPGIENQCLAIVDFYLKESPSNSKLIWGTYDSTRGWEFKDVLKLPYLHRFDIYKMQTKTYVVLATIADDKEYKDDWTRPGSIYYGELTDNPSEGVALTKLVGNMFRNHGYYRCEDTDGIQGYFTSDEGILKVTPSETEPWKLEWILDGQVGEVAVLDINGDGNKELITIEPFHGNAIHIYELNDSESYERVYTFDFQLDFAHTLVGATLRGIPSFVGGIRRVGCELFIVQYINDKYHVEIVDSGAGPANLTVMYQKNREIIISANHTRNECAAYIIE